MKSGITLLLVDDHSFLRRGLRGFLERELPNSRIREAASAEEAYQLLKEAPAQLILLDLHLPGDDGITAAKKIQATHSESQIIIVSGQSSKDEPKNSVRIALLAGVKGFISKSDGEMFTLQAVQAALNGHCFLSPAACTELTKELRHEAAISSEKSKLTTQELSVLKRIAEGASYKDIADELEISVKTVDTYRTRLVKKLEISSREELQDFARKFGLTT